MKTSHKIAVNLLNLISKTWRIKIEGKFPDKPGIILFWHGKMLPVWKSFSKHSPVGVVSKSKDGQILSALLEKWNFRLIRGSSSSDSKKVLNDMQELAPGNFMLITPDGPRGPMNKMKAGGVITALRAEVPLYLCGVKISKKHIFEKSWDKFNLPMPFSSIILSFSDKHILKRDSEREEIDRIICDLENKLIKMDVD